MKPKHRRRVLGLLLALAVVWGLLRGGWLAPDDPGALLRQRYGSTRLLDRRGLPLRSFTGALRTRTRLLPLGEFSPHLVAATLAAEDRRFWRHPGIDPLAIARAALGNVRDGRVTSGASTLTQQLVKLMQPRPRTLRFKATEALVAMNLDARFTKAQILAWYLDFAPYGGLLRGCEQAAQTLFGKPARDLTLAEAAYLAVLPRSPTRLDPLRGPQHAVPAQRALLAQMLDNHLISEADWQIAVDQPIRIATTAGTVTAAHFADWVAEQLGPLLMQRPVAVRTTLDGDLQRDLQDIVARHVERLRGKSVGNAAVVVLDNATREVRAMVGSAGYGDLAHLGANNGATALRQPGSTMKAFTFATAFDLGFTPATVLPDLEASFDTPQGPWTPRNYGGGFSGPVRARLALANSVNVASVQMLARIGVPALRDRLARLGFVSLASHAEHYGLGLTLGDGEVTLLELANAYATLARGGMHAPMTWLQEVQLADGTAVALPRGAETRVFSQQAAWLAVDVLADPQARELAFGRHGVLELPFPAFAKTGTSKGFRDNWAVAGTPRWTVAVWVGNFDGTAMAGVSGVTGAGPLVHDVLLRVVGDEAPQPFARPAGLREAPICALSGGLATPACPQVIHEWFQETTVMSPCAWHVPVALDRRNGLRAGPDCRQDQVTSSVFALLPAPYTAWARAHLPAPPIGYSPLCPAGRQVQSARIHIDSPRDGSVFVRDSLLPDDVQSIGLLAQGADPADLLRWQVDGVTLATVRSGERALWPVRKGRHRLTVQALRGGEAYVDVEVRAVGSAER